MHYVVYARWTCLVLKAHLDILHLDFKRENVVVSEDNSVSIKAQLIAFEYSCRGSQEDDLISMPFPPPWTAPEHEWKEHLISSAMRMDI